MLKQHTDLSDNTLFQQDSAPAQKACIVTDWFKIEGIGFLTLPSNSPDLNVIENCWNLTKQKVPAHRPSPISVKRGAGECLGI